MYMYVYGRHNNATHVKSARTAEKRHPDPRLDQISNSKSDSYYTPTPMSLSNIQVLPLYEPVPIALRSLQ